MTDFPLTELFNAGYKVINNKQGAKFFIIISYPTRASGIIVLNSSIDMIIWTFQFDLNQVMV